MPKVSSGSDVPLNLVWKLRRPFNLMFSIDGVNKNDDWVIIEEPVEIEGAWYDGGDVDGLGGAGIEDSVRNIEAIDDRIGRNDFVGDIL